MEKAPAPSQRSSKNSAASTSILNLVCTEHPLHGMELARQAVLEGFDVIVAAGGDGTVNEVLNGLIEARIPARTARRWVCCAQAAGMILPPAYASPQSWRMSAGCSRKAIVA